MPIFLFVELWIADGWDDLFQHTQVLRQSAGAVRHWVYRHAERSDDALVVLEFDDPAAAVAFAESAALEDRMAAPVRRVELRFQAEAMDY